jgi:hypothetical protein
MTLILRCPDLLASWSFLNQSDHFLLKGDSF